MCERFITTGTFEISFTSMAIEMSLKCILTAKFFTAHRAFISFILVVHFLMPVSVVFLFELLLAYMARKHIFSGLVHVPAANSATTTCACLTRAYTVRRDVVVAGRVT